MLAHFKNLHWPRLQTLFRWAFHLGWISLALSLIFYLLGLRLLAEVDQYRPRLEAAISEALTAPVHIERLEGDWRGLHPEVRIRNLRIGHPAAPDTTLGPSRSSILTTHSPPALRAKSHDPTAATRLPRWSGPVGDGAKRPRTAAVTGPAPASRSPRRLSRSIPPPGPPGEPARG